jgi:O-antigen/teichoic acid export membrane protein
LLLTLLLALAGMALLLVFGEFLLGLVAENQDWHVGYALVVPLLALMNGIFALSRQYFAKSRRYRRLSLTIFLRTLVMVASQLGLVVLLPGPGGLIAGFGLGLGLAIILAWPVPAAILSRVAAAPGEALRMTRATIHRHSGYIRVDLANVLISASALSIYPIIVLLRFGAEEAGIFAVASRFVFIPVNVLAGSVSTVYFQRLSLAVRQGEGILRLFGVTLSLATVAAASISLVVFVVADPFVRIFFPLEWFQTSHVMLLLLPTFAVRFIIGCIGSTPLALSRPGFLFVWNLAQIAIIGLTWIATINESLDVFLLVSGSGLVVAGAFYIAILSLSIRQHVN